MLTYTTLQNRPREFLAATGLTHAEFARLLPAFATAYAALYSSDQTLEGKPRQRRVGGGTPGALPQMEDKKAADAASIIYPDNATLDKHTSFQGYEPVGILIAQPKKAERSGVECG